MMTVSTASPDASGVDHFPWDLLIPLLPKLAAVLLVVALLVIIGPRRIVAAVGRIKKIGFAGLEIELTQAVEAVADERKIGLTPAEAAVLGRELADAAHLLSCRRVLWVDDYPGGNRFEIDVLRRLCVEIDLARSTREAREMLARGVYDLIISDIGRENGESGLESVFLAKEAPYSPTVVFYVRKLDGPPPEGSYGIASRPDKLFHLVIGALTSRRASFQSATRSPEGERAVLIGD